MSLLTCSPGEDLYTTFGHTAIRVTDSATGSDRVYNYGTFDFSNPSAFYLKFIKGGKELRYFLSVDDFSDFMREYEYDKRSVVEQELNLNCNEMNRLNMALQQNAMGENKFYQYDFVFDNCSTRPYEMIRKNLDSPLSMLNVLPSPRTSFRKLINFYLEQNKMYWSELGIDILLGSRIDRPMKNKEAMFLPDYLFNGFDGATSGSKLLVSGRQVLYKAPVSGKDDSSICTPVIVFNAFLVIVLILGVVRNTMTNRLSAVTDFILFFFSGAIGLTILFMWLGTDHQVCRNNFSLLWAFPSHLPAAFLIFSRANWMKRYWLFSATLSTLVLLTWFILPQEFNKALLPIVILLAWRSWSHFKQI